MSNPDEDNDREILRLNLENQFSLVAKVTADAVRYVLCHEEVIGELGEVEVPATVTIEDAAVLAAMAGARHKR